MPHPVVTLVESLTDGYGLDTTPDIDITIGSKTAYIVGF